MTVSGALRAARIALFATAAVVAAPVSLFAQDIACDAGDLEVRALEFRGNNAVSDDDLAIRVTTTPSSWARRKLNLWFADRRCLNKDELELDSLKLKEYYRQRGYYTTRIGTIVEQIDPGAVRVIFNIDEGQPVRLVSYNVTGLSGVRDAASIMQRLRLRVGAAFDQGLFQADMDSIVQRLRNAGYYRAAVLHSYDTDTIALRATAGIEVMPGKPAKFGVPKVYALPVSPREPQQIKNEVVLRVLGIRPGDPYSDRAIVEAQRNLFQLGTYRHISVAPLPDSLQLPGDTIVVLEVRLNEDYMRQVDSEIGWATLDCMRVRAQYTDKNLFGKVRRLDLTGQVSKLGYGYPLASTTTRHMCTLGNATELRKDTIFSDSLNYFAAATFRQPRLLGTRWVPTVSVFSERRSEFLAYLRSTPIGADFSATRDVRERMPLRLGYTVEYGRTAAQPAAFCALFNLCDPEATKPLTDLATLGVASATLARIRTDNLINPGRGYTARGELRTSASRALATSDTSFYFNKGTADLAWYRRIDSRNVLAFRVRAGAVLGRRLRLNDPVVVPTQERLFAGGPTSVRGFQQNELGPLAYISDGIIVERDSVPTPGDTIFHFEQSLGPDSLDLGRSIPLGGNSLLVTNFEYRFRDPFFFPNFLQYVLFVDGGNVWTRGQKSRFVVTPGLGFRALTAVGPVQINVGYNGYPREAGPLYFNPDITKLLCVSPGNEVTYERGPDGTFTPRDDTRCNAFKPPARDRLLQRLTFTFSIGTDF